MGSIALAGLIASACTTGPEAPKTPTYTATLAPGAGILIYACDVASTALGQAWMAVVAAEIFGMPGLGHRMIEASALLATDIVVVYMLTMAALYGVVWISLRLIGLADPGHRMAMAWTAVGIWTEPLRSTFDYGQINVILVLGVLYAVYSTRWWWSGLLVGVAAGVKLTPAVTGLYFLGVRRWGAAVFAAVTFVGTVLVSWLVLRDQALYYFTDLLGDANRIGPVATSFNQSWRGAISRIVGHDAGFEPAVVVAVLVTAVLAVFAWRAVYGADRPDRLGALLVVQLFGLVFSPISWTHHWVWLIPLMMWLWHGPFAALGSARALRWTWLVLMIVGVPWLLSFAQPTIWVISRPWYLAWAGLIYPVMTLVTLAWMARRATIKR